MAVLALVVVLGITLIGVATSGDDNERSAARDGQDSPEPRTAMWDASATQNEVLASLEADFCDKVNVIPMPHLGSTQVWCFHEENPNGVITFHVYPDAETYDVAASAGIPCGGEDFILVHGPTWMAESLSAADLVPLVKAGGTQDSCG